jgi:hypothetical protein
MINQQKEQKNQFFKMHKASYIMIAAAMIIVASIFLSPAFSTSTSQCNSCHAGYNQYLDILEGNAVNQLPTTLTVGQTATVTVIVENNVNTVVYTALSSVSLTLSSQNGHFTVSAPTYNIGALPKGTAIATWQITGVSAGIDSYVIGATAKNSHQSLSFQDTYSPAPAITISAPVSTPVPTSIPTTAPIPTSTSTITPAPTTIPGSSSTSTPTPVQTPSPTATSTYTSTTQPTPTSTPNTNNPSSNSSNQQSALTIWFITPTEGATLTTGHKTIEWITTGGSGSSSITLELSKVGSSGPWTTLAENLTSSNNYIWTVPNQQADCIIRATAIDSINPTQKASVTIATKIDSIIQPETTAIISITLTALLFAILAMLILKRRIKQNENQKGQKKVALKTMQNSLNQSFCPKLLQSKFYLVRFIE